MAAVKAGRRTREDRWPELLAFDRSCCPEGLLCGTDEVGRGPLAGPVVAAAVVLRPDACIPGLDDSKVLTPAERAALYPLICCQSLAVGIGWVDAGTIDVLNIHHASIEAMRRAVSRIQVEPSLLLIDGRFRLRDYSGHQRCLIDADATSAAVAAAAIVAKVMRDRYMVALHQRHPEYGFDSHKGYSARRQIEAMKLHGPCFHHRKSFTPNALRPPDPTFEFVVAEEE
ncbi:MAG TPA: ribonuclease HII [bacterium]|nr:ribonuclease HII [bacterium]